MNNHATTITLRLRIRYRLIRLFASLVILVCLPINSANSFKFGPHKDITLKGLSRVNYVLEGRGPLKFSEGAILESADGNIGTDTGTFFGLLSEVPHCDADTIESCVNRVQEGLERIVDTLIRANFREPQNDFYLNDVARNVRIHFFGSVLHTIQDFYTHSNWPELGYRFVDFGEPYSRAIPVDARGGSLPPCPLGDGTTYADGARLGSGYYYLPGIGDYFAGLKASEGFCIHGENFELSGYPMGMHKDKAGRDHFTRASVKAEISTFHIATKILNQLNDAGAYRAMCAFVGMPIDICVEPAAFWSGFYVIEECNVPDTVVGGHSFNTCGWALHGSGAAHTGEISFRSGSGEVANVRRDFRVIFDQYPVCDNATIPIIPTSGNSFQFPIRFGTATYDYNPRNSKLVFTIESVDEAGRIQGSFDGVIWYASLSGQEQQKNIKGSVRGSWSANQSIAFPKCTYPPPAQICQQVSNTGFNWPLGEQGPCDWRDLYSEARPREWLDNPAE